MVEGKSVMCKYFTVNTNKKSARHYVCAKAYKCTRGHTSKVSAKIDFLGQNRIQQINENCNSTSSNS